ncbi:MAG: DUF3348 domain-containing protein [Rhodocyclales bacterium]|nr:DUF3348 domain-containing protein [Rhodocyclales bacterium]
MRSPLPRTSFNSPRLVRLLAALDVDDVAESKQSFAERLGQWLDLNDAIALSGTLHAGAGGSPAARSRALGPVEEQFARVRASLIDSIATDGVFKPGRARIKLPVPAAGATLATADFAPYRRYYAAHQRDMEASIGPLRANLRAALVEHSPALRQLADLDAVIDKALGERERNLLATVPQRLEQRYRQLRQAYAEALAEAPQADDPERWLQPGGWLAAFCRDLQAVLLAELELRLQPAAGLLAAIAGSAPSAATAE